MRRRRAVRSGRLQGDPQREDDGTGRGAEPAHTPVHLPVLLAVAGQGGQRRQRTQWVEPFELRRGRFGEHGSRQNRQERQQVDRGEVGAGDGGRRRFMKGNFPAGLFPPQPRHPAGAGDANGRDQDEADPAGLGMKSSQCDPRRAGIAQGEQRSDARGIHHPDDYHADRQQKQSPRKAIFAPREPQPGAAEGQHQADAFEARAFVGDLHVEAARPQRQVAGVDRETRNPRLQQAADHEKGQCAERAPKIPGEAANPRAGERCRNREHQHIPARGKQAQPHGRRQKGQPGTDHRQHAGQDPRAGKPVGARRRQRVAEYAYRQKPG